MGLGKLIETLLSILSSRVRVMFLEAILAQVDCIQVLNGWGGYHDI